MITGKRDRKDKSKVDFMTELTLKLTGGNSVEDVKLERESD